LKKHTFYTFTWIYIGNDVKDVHTLENDLERSLFVLFVVKFVNYFEKVDIARKIQLKYLHRLANISCSKNATFLNVQSNLPMWSPLISSHLY